jgi:hypothetical protein
LTGIHCFTFFSSYQIVSHHINIEMSEIAKPVEATPAPAAIGGTDSTPVPSTTPAAATTDSAPATDAITPSSQTAPVAPKDETVEKGAAKVEGPPAGEGILGYKKPGLIQ